MSLFTVIKELRHMGDWIDSARCAEPDVDPELFFIERGGTTAPARLICGQCPVVKECLDYSLSTPGDEHGVWGGASYAQRRAIKTHRLGPEAVGAAFIRQLQDEADGTKKPIRGTNQSRGRPIPEVTEEDVA